MMIKFIDILASGASWARPWKVFHYTYGADQDLICIMGGTRACTVTFGSQMSTAILGVRMRDPNKMEIPRSVRELGVLYGSAEGPPRGVENRNLLSHPDDLRMEAYVIRMT